MRRSASVLTVTAGLNNITWIITQTKIWYEISLCLIPLSALNSTNQFTQILRGWNSAPDRQSTDLATLQTGQFKLLTQFLNQQQFTLSANLYPIWLSNYVQAKSYVSNKVQTI